MPPELSSDDVANLLRKLVLSLSGMGKKISMRGISVAKFARWIVPRNKRSIPKGTLASIFRQAGITRKEAEKLLRGEQLD
jgi:hypothetical protein